ncbi:hypothetical protein ACROYT_G001596 [Oculina patagonica]
MNTSYISLERRNFELLQEAFPQDLSKRSQTDLWSTTHATDRWIYVQLPIIQDKVNVSISFSGKVQSKGQTIIAIDDVSFSPERCEKIPFTTNQNDREKGEDLSAWKSTKSNASWKLISFEETRELHKQIRQQELNGLHPRMMQLSSLLYE